MFMRVVATHSTVTATVNRYSHFFSFHVKTTLGQCTVAPQGDPDAHSLHDTSHMHPPPALRPREAAARTPGRRYASVHTVPIRRNFGSEKTILRERRCRRPLGPQIRTRDFCAATATARG